MPHVFQKHNYHTSQINEDLVNKYRQEFLRDKSNK